MHKYFALRFKVFNLAQSITKFSNCQNFAKKTIGGKIYSYFLIQGVEIFNGVYFFSLKTSASIADN